VRIAGEKVLVVVLGGPIVLHALQLCHDGAGVRPALSQLVQHLLCRGLLRHIREVDAAAVLGAVIIALGIAGGRVMDHKKDLQYFAQADDLRIKFKLDHLGVAGVAATNLFVARLSQLPVAVTRLHRQYALDIDINSIQAPKTPAAKDNAGGADLSRCGHMGELILIKRLGPLDQAAVSPGE
jgi:hypothetical protein